MTKFVVNEHVTPLMSDADRAESVVLAKGWLSRTPDRFQHAVFERCILRKFRSGSSIYRRGDPPGGLFGLVSGSLAVDISPLERGPFMGYFLRPGAWVGGAPAFTGQPRVVGLRATRSTELLYLPLHAINAIVAQDDSAWRYFALIGFAHLEIAMSVVDDLMRRDHKKRFVAMLLHLADCRSASPTDGAPIEIDVGQEELAIMANVARTTAGAILRQLARAGHVDTSYKRVRILSPDALRAMLIRPTPAARRRPPLLQPDLHLADLAAKSKRTTVEVNKRHGRA
ncbi:Crp/Fnr family transcriptional regulator [Reyranella sp.]|uniref:Crp/Fnr family transcriptional regulator n=1 Tax=Reyranella sp. TaxID=1929291 RepID=UPI003D09C7BC